jgi:hypothetical protein
LTRSAFRGPGRRFGHVRRLPEPPFTIATDSRCVRECAKACERLQRGRARRAVVAPEEIEIHPGCLGVREYGVECLGVSVNVIKDP